MPISRVASYLAEVINPIFDIWRPKWAWLDKETKLVH